MKTKDIVTIKEISPVYSQISHPDLIRDTLSYKSEYWVQGRYKKERHEYIKYLINKKGVYLSGFNYKIISFLEKQKNNFNFLKEYVIIRSTRPHLKNIIFREDQKNALKTMLASERGLFKAPTGSGKTILLCGIVSALPTTVLVIVHTKSLYNQLFKELSRFFNDIGEISASKFECKDITIAMRKTLISKMKKKGKGFPSNFSFNWGAIIVDEAHHVSTFDCEYAFILKNIFAPRRYGFTATLPSSKLNLLAMEGLIGPVLGNTSYKELEEKEILAKPKLKILKNNSKIDGLVGSYLSVYESAIVNNLKRNKKIIGLACKMLAKDRTVLIMVDQVQHGKNLLALLNKDAPNKFVFLHGNTSSEEIEIEKQAFIKKKRAGVIATKIWNEGINIPSLDVVINAAGGESVIKITQIFGRGLRRTKEKSKVLFYDIVDLNHKWFIAHSLNRLLLYIKLGWLS